MQGTLRTGDQIGTWVVVEPLGAGGMGEVYRCHSALTERVQSAVKVMSGSTSKAAQKRFIREIEVLSSMQHPAIVRVLGGGSDDARGTLFMVMELVEGKDLATFITGRQLPWQEAVRVIRDAAVGLAAVHRAGVFHRDLKPANLMIGPRGVVKIIDFGVALSPGQTRLTRQRAVPGTLAYMPPEVFTQGSFDTGLGDLYSLGVCLYEAITGLRGFSEDPDLSDIQRFVAVMGIKTRCECLDPGPSFRDNLREVVRVATARVPGERYDDAQAFADKLTELLVGEPASEWVSPPANALLARRTDDTFTLDTSAPSAEIDVPCAVLDEAPVVAQETTLEPLARFPYFSLATTLMAGFSPPAWGLFWALVALVVPPLGGGVWVMSMIFAPAVLPVFGVVGFMTSFWFVLRVRRSTRRPEPWYVLVLILVALHTWHLALALADSALMIAVFDQALQDFQSGKGR